MVGLGVPVSSLIGASTAMADTNFPCGTKGTYTVSATQALTTFSADCAGDITIDPSVTSINSKDEYLAQGITSVAIPAATTSISFASAGFGAFFSVGKLHTITVAASNPSFTAIDGVLFNKTATTLITYPPAKKDTIYSIPSTVTELGDYSFNNSANLLTLNVPASVAKVSHYTFYNQSSITTVVVEPLNSNFKSIDGVLYSKDGSYLHFYPDSKSDLTFTIPNTVTELGYGAVDSTKFLQGVVLPTGLKTINGRSISFNYALTSVSNIPASVTTLQSSSFYGNRLLPELNVDLANPNFKSINGVLFDKAGTTLIAYPSGATALSYTVPSTVTVIKSSSFSSALLQYLSILQNVTVLPNPGYAYALKIINYCGTDSASKTGLLDLGTNDSPAPTMVCDTGLTLSTPVSNTIFQMKVGEPFKSPISPELAFGPYTVAVTTGTLPAGLSISADFTSIAGTPTTAGTFSGVALTATDVFGYTKTIAGLSFKVAAADKAAAAKKISITCVKGKLTKKVTAIKPVCPAGYKKK